MGHYRRQDLCLVGVPTAVRRKLHWKATFHRKRRLRMYACMCRMFWWWPYTNVFHLVVCLSAFLSATLCWSFQVRLEASDSSLRHYRVIQRPARRPRDERKDEDNETVDRRSVLERWKINGENVRPFTPRRGGPGLHARGQRGLVLEKELVAWCIQTIQIDQVCLCATARVKITFAYCSTHRL